MSGKLVFLHLSDLHFGDENETDAARRWDTLDKLLLVLKGLPHGWKPQSIVISGDIAWSGREKDYLKAEEWLGKLMGVLGLSAEDIVPAAGNHDIDLKKAKGTAAPSDYNTADDLLDLDLLESLSGPFGGFEEFCKRMGIPPLTLGSKRSYLAGFREHNGVMWLVLNSAWFCRKGRKDKLHIGLPHLQVITAAEEWKKRGIPAVGILHHPPESLHDEELNSYGSRRNTYDLLAGECEIILSGHVHGELKEPDVKFDKSHLFTGGSSYGSEKDRNNVSFFRFDRSRRSVERRAHQWVPGDGVWELREKYSKSYSMTRGEVKVGPVDLSRKLFEGSRRYYEDLRGESGRFRHLDISDIILQQPNRQWLDSPIKSFSGGPGGRLFKKAPLVGILPELWQEGCKHAVVKGDGGMGKTVSLVRLWDEFTREYDPARPVPVFIQLNEINTVAEEKRMDFILSTIKENYFNGEVSEEEVLRFLKEGGEVASVVLLLDGFNEVTVDNKELLIQIRKLMEQARGVQVVITSRYDMRESYGWKHLHLLELGGLEEAQVREYLEEKKVKMPEGRLAGLMRNPMMLTLYASTCEVQGKYKGDYKTKVETAGELLWNFIEAQVAVWLERLHYDQKQWWYYKFLLKFMLPAVGYEMEREGLYAFEREALYRVLDRYCLRFSRSDFFNAFPEYRKYEDSPPTGACADEKAGRKRINEIENVLCNVLLMVVKEGETYRFLHQDFRDYFAALHVLHETEMGLKRGEVSEVLKERALPVYVRRFIGEIEGEHYQRPIFEEGKGWVQEINENSLLNRVLGLCRGMFDGSVGFGPWNVVEVWKEVRGELSGADLSGLDLSRVVLNSALCSRFFRSEYLAACFNQSLLYEMCLFPQGHSSFIYNAVFSPNGKKILSASDDRTVKEWDVESGQCVKTFIGHAASVKNTHYNPDGQKILSASYDKTIKEWDVESGRCIKTYIGHNDVIKSSVYSSDGKKILSTSGDCTIKEWDIENGQCIKTFIGHKESVTIAVYSIDGKRILSASYDGTIKEWDVESRQCLKTYTGHSASVRSVCYSKNGEKFLSTSYDATIKEWSVKSGQCLKTLVGHCGLVNNAIYSSDERKILSASYDNTIKEWDVESGQCLKTFSGHTKNVNSSCYSSDEKKILSASWDQSIKEWDVESGRCLKTFTGNASLVTNACYGENGKKVLSTSMDSTIKEWDIESGKCDKTFTGHIDMVWIACYSENGGKIISASKDGTIKEWDVESGKCIKTFHEHENPVWKVHYMKEGKTIISASDDGIIKEWDADRGNCFVTNIGSLFELMDIESINLPREKLVTTGNKIEIISRKDFTILWTLTNIPGLFIHGCSFENLHPDSDLSDESKDLLRMYGAKI